MKIISRTDLVDLPNLKIIEIKITAPYIAAKAKPGEFVVLMSERQSERIPLRAC